jgi:hypothetical protein
MSSYTINIDSLENRVKIVIGSIIDEGNFYGGVEYSASRASIEFPIQLSSGNLEKELEYLKDEKRNMISFGGWDGGNISFERTSNSANLEIEFDTANSVWKEEFESASFKIKCAISIDAFEKLREDCIYLLEWLIKEGKEIEDLN